MSEFRLKGRIIKMGELQVFDSGFRKVDFVLQTEGQYPQDIKFESHKDRAESTLKFNKEGDEVEVSFNIKGNEHEGKYYVSLLAWRIDQ